MADYAELQVTSNFSFLRGASHPEELVESAARLGHAAVAIADRNSLAGAVRAHIAAKSHGIKLLVGTRLVLEDGEELLAFPHDRPAYARLSRLLSIGKRRAEKGACLLRRADVADHAAGHDLVFLPPPDLTGLSASNLALWTRSFSGRVSLAASMLYHGDDAGRLRQLAVLSAEAGLPLVATNDVHYHVPERRPLQDVLTCIREHCSVDEAGWRLDANAERYLKPPEEMARLFRDWPEAVACTIEIAARCRFSLDELAYEYPDEISPDGLPVQEELEFRTFEGAAERYPDGVPPKVEAQLRHELSLIARLSYAPYFLTVYDMVRFARSQDILCQGRGSAANSAVCYCLGITAVDPSRADLLFERFVSEERGEPPDIDVDFEHERREEVIQYIYEKYGRERAGLAATVISYRSRSALRDVGKAMGLSEDVVGLLSSQVWGRHGDAVADERIREVGLDPADRRLAMAMNLTRQLMGFPRHLSQHVGGFVITRGRLDELVPIENAAMQDRTVIEWDKDDLDALGMLKVDVLALGMLTCVKKAFDLLERHYGVAHDLATVPPEDPGVYDMLCRGDSLGVFQVESRAQMAMLPRLRPRCFYDLVIEVAIVRPGPIQGDMVHPYLRRRDGIEPVEFPSDELRGVLGKTLGVPLFQEQAMKIAIVAAGFTPSEADRLRRAMATFKKTGQIGQFRDKMIEGMVARNYEREFAERCFRQIEGFGNYGFPESHAASFALLVYVSSWFKRRYPAVFAAALLNSQPMGFYAPAQIVRDAREHGVTVLPPDVNKSGWDCDLEPDGRGGQALRLGLRQIKGMRKEEAELIAACRGRGYGDPGELWRRAGITPAVLEVLARGDAFSSMGLARREVFWAVRGLARAVTGPVRAERYRDGLPLFLAAEAREQKLFTQREAAILLPEAPLGEQVVDDYAALHLSLKAHPVALLRPSLDGDGCIRCEDLDRSRDGRRIRLGGLVLVRQRPGTAKGVIFITLEDESGVANLIVWPDKFETFRRIVLGAKFLGVTGLVQREGRVVHVVVEKLEDLTYRLGWLTDGTVDEAGFGKAIANADEVARGQEDYRQKPPRPKLPPAPKPNPEQIKPSRPLHTHPRNMKPDLRVVSRDFH
ncbi:error-prone DNA polymerase [Nisaea acidiphila]|uniref:Error-prone DNA polymerase n=1 Tax=Nisaea acidiphila TaxID=1862145 RepID=A0A9J7AZU5_9PROT|nr:error-prone DNA polymerase [Nisaea acidiphila]UUX50973.1 error-prone DNA polymerase [Nisaea acidiphila]